MSLDESNNGVSSSFGMPVTGRGPGSLLRRVVAKFVWPFLRHQVDLNHVVLAELRDLQARQQETLDVVEHQLSANGHTTVSIRQLGDQVDFVEDGLHNVERALHILEEQYTTVVEQRESHLRDVQQHLTARTNELENQIDLGQRQLLSRFYDGFGALQRDVSDMATQVTSLSLRGDQDAQSLRGDFEGVLVRMAEVLARMAEVDHFLTEVKRSYPEPVAPERLTQLTTGFDAIARAHALRFRGTPELVKERVAVYVPELKAVAGLGRVVDIGCGAGELLEVLRDAEIDAYGIDTASAAVDECLARGLDARVDDALHHLGSLPAASLAAVTAIHVVEHLSADALIEMIDLALRALRPGGMVIFETPNPANVNVGANSFYLDPTHHHPLPSAYLEFLVSIRGFADARVLPLQRGPQVFDETDPGEGEWANGITRFATRVSQSMMGAEDYAVIARRAL